MNGRSISILHEWILRFAMDSFETDVNGAVGVFDWTIRTDKM